MIDTEMAALLFRLVLSISVALVTAYVLPFIEEKRKDNRYKTVIDIITLAVKAAEQTITGSGQGKAKKAEVMRFVSEWLSKQGITITEEELSQLIEAAVYQMKQE